MKINEDAALDFIAISTISLYYDLIDNLEYSKRVYSLNEMLDRKLIHIILLLFKKNVEPISLEEKEIFEGYREESFIDNNVIVKKQKTSAANSEYNDIKIDNGRDIYSYTTKKSGVYDTKWCFFEGDIDHTPSIPHGHSIKKHKVVLNPFTREILPDKRRKEDKKLVNNLWNDEKFRETAWKNLNFHLVIPEHRSVALEYKKLIKEKFKK